jgi:hypothetical protein
VRAAPLSPPSPEIGSKVRTECYYVRENAFRLQKMQFGRMLVITVPICRPAVYLVIALIMGLLCTAANAQSISDVVAPPEPLILKQQGSFFVGGQQTESDATGWDQTPPVSAFGSGDVTIDQMYVQFQIPLTSRKEKIPLVFVHGCCLSSKTWETTPDGRMRWYEYFTRLGYPTYLAEQSGRARSGFNGTIYNEVKLGLKPPSAQPFVLIATYQFAWSVFRFGPSALTETDES